MRSRKRNPRVFEPTDRDIRRECEKIQERWSEKERNKRAGRSKVRHWLPPIVDSELLFPDGNQLSSDLPAG